MSELGMNSRTLHFLEGGGACGRLIRNLDWSQTELGSPHGWPESLRTLVGVMLTSNQPMLIVWGPRFTTIYNDGYAAMCGKRHPQAMGRGFDELWFDIWAEVKPILSKAYAGIPTQMDDITFIMHRNGYPEETHFAFSYTPVRTGDGAVAGMFCACSETTDVVLTKRSIDEERARQLHNMLQMPGFVAILSGPEHRFDYVNDAYRVIAGDRDFIGRTVRDVFPELADQGFYDLLDTVYRSGEPFRAESMPIALQGRGEDRYIDFLYQPIRGNDQEVIGIFVGGYDVTDRVRAERDLRQLSESLEERLREQARVLHESEMALRQSQKMEAVGQLTGGLAHDFNNLLAGISGALEMIERRAGQGRYADVERYISGALEAARRASALTHRLLAFSRRQTLAPRHAEASAVVDGLSELIQRTAGPAIDVRQIAGPEPAWVLADISQFENAILNLCINARDAMPDGGSITIETKISQLSAGSDLDLAAGDYVCISVRDTGTGMSEDVLAKAFDPFFTTKPLGEGTGLGLSMIYGFAKQSGGQVQIASQLGVGTTVSLYLPRAAARSNGDDGKADIVPQLPSQRADRGQTVLVVDDEPTVRMLVADILKELGLVIIEADEARGAMRIIESDASIDLLVTDVGLPGGLNGRQLADAARMRRPTLPVLFITGYAETSLLRDGQLEPGMGVLTKPFSIDALVAETQALLG